MRIRPQPQDYSSDNSDYENEQSEAMRGLTQEEFEEHDRIISEIRGHFNAILRLTNTTFALDLRRLTSPQARALRLFLTLSNGDE